MIDSFTVSQLIKKEERKKHACLISCVQPRRQLSSFVIRTKRHVTHDASAKMRGRLFARNVGVQILDNTPKKRDKGVGNPLPSCCLKPVDPPSCKENVLALSTSKNDDMEFKLPHPREPQTVIRNLLRWNRAVTSNLQQKYCSYQHQICGQKQLRKAWTWAHGWPETEQFCVVVSRASSHGETN